MSRVNRQRTFFTVCGMVVGLAGFLLLLYAGLASNVVVVVLAAVITVAIVVGRRLFTPRVDAPNSAAVVIIECPLDRVPGASIGARIASRCTRDDRIRPDLRCDHLALGEVLR